MKDERLMDAKRARRERQKRRATNDCELIELKVMARSPKLVARGYHTIFESG